MARLIPSFMDDRTPPGERDVFNLLASGPDDWVALHSLDLAPWNRSLRTEIDFVIVVPDIGILCMEVKSHEHIEFDGNRWYPSTISRSPFKQAADGRHTLYRRLAALAPQYKRVPIVHCCVFPRAEFHVAPNLSVAAWELMDVRTFRTFQSGESFCIDLKIRMRKSISADSQLETIPAPLTQSQIEQFVGLCVPVHRRHPDAREGIRQREKDIERVLLEQQKPVLQLARLNDKLVVSGAAGTGKTLIAMEVARRAAESGRRVGFFCYNKLIGDWIKANVNSGIPAQPNLVAGRAIRMMAEMAEIYIPENPTAKYWETELPSRLEDRLTDPDFKGAVAFDYLVLDEAQDLLARPQLWGCLQQFLRGGLERGAFALFGDFEHQTLTDREPLNAALRVLTEEIRPVKWSLTENCRNYRIVGDTAIRLSGIPEDVYSGYRRSGGSIQSYDISFYQNENEQLELLIKWLRDFVEMGYRATDITLLSFRSDETSAAARLANAGHKLQPAWQQGQRASYSTVHAFKGMENKIVVLTDVVLEDRDFHRDLFYVGMTRATEVVRVLCAADSMAVLTTWLSKKG
jgi:hypothetical protein